MRRVIDHHVGRAVGRIKRHARARMTDGSDIGPLTAIKHIELTISSDGRARRPIQRGPSKDLTGVANEVSLSVVEIGPAAHLLGQAIAETHVVAIDPAAFRTVLGVLFVDTRLKS